MEKAELEGWDGGRDIQDEGSMNNDPQARSVLTCFALELKKPSVLQESRWG